MRIRFLAGWVILITLSIQGHDIRIENATDDCVIAYNIIFYSIRSFCKVVPAFPYKHTIQPQKYRLIKGAIGGDLPCCIKRIEIQASRRTKNMHVPLPASTTYRPSNGCKSLSIKVEEEKGQLKVID